MLRQSFYVTSSRQKTISSKDNNSWHIRKNRRELSSEMTDHKKGGINSSQFLINEDVNALFVRYQPKATKTVYILSTMHISANVEENTIKKKLDMILFCNQNKGGVDV